MCEDDDNIWLRVNFSTSCPSEKVDYKEFSCQMDLESMVVVGDKLLFTNINYVLIILLSFLHTVIFSLSKYPCL